MKNKQNGMCTRLTIKKKKNYFIKYHACYIPIQLLPQSYIPILLVPQSNILLDCQ